MPVVKGCGTLPRAWEQLHLQLNNREEMLRQKAGAVKSIRHVLEASFDALGRRKQENLMSLAVLPKAAVAPMEMLLNLWDFEVCCVVLCARCRAISSGAGGHLLANVYGYLWTHFGICFVTEIGLRGDCRA